MLFLAHSDPDVDYFARYVNRRNTIFLFFLKKEVIGYKSLPLVYTELLDAMKGRGQPEHAQYTASCVKD